MIHELCKNYAASDCRMTVNDELERCGSSHALLYEIVTRHSPREPEENKNLSE
jgi:hypothetical protein